MNHRSDAHGHEVALDTEALQREITSDSYPLSIEQSVCVWWLSAIYFRLLIRLNDIFNDTLELFYGFRYYLLATSSTEELRC